METRYLDKASPDNGCKYATRCLECPFDTCLYEQPGGKAHFLKSRRNNEIIRLAREGKTTNEISQKFGMSRRSIQRILAVDRHAKLTS